MTKRIDFGPLKIPVTEYASQGNAILGIRDSGKSYTATYLAERLLESGVPFVAFDPIGISCRICERTGCRQRAVPPLKRHLSVDRNRRGAVPYRIA